MTQKRDTPQSNPPQEAPTELSPVLSHDDPEQALFDGRLKGLVVSLCQDERPLTGLAGLMDWRFGGWISSCLRSGALSGVPGECAYLPFTRHGTTYHLIVAGSGRTPLHGGKRGPLPPETWQALRKNLATLGLAPIGLSRADLGNVPEDVLVQQLKGLPMVIVP